ncbi:MAG: hypothetical protein BIFFINMI_02264 [Phycisphaerae bacterium]|nr:hypothetical protein [Phycisphaerae bacterium]
MAYTCPHCRCRLTESRDGDTIFWMCEKCTGCAVGVSVLRRIVARDAINRVWLHARRLMKADQRGPIDCPYCGLKMFRVDPPPGDATTPPLDVCTACLMVWFDPKELEALPPPPAPEMEKAMSPQSREALAMWRLRRLAERDGIGHDIPPMLPTTWWRAVLAFFGLPME